MRRRGREGINQVQDLEILLAPPPLCTQAVMRLQGREWGSRSSGSLSDLAQAAEGF